MPPTERMSVTFTIRVPIGLMDQVRTDVESSGEFGSVSQWVVAAMREYLQQRKMYSGKIEKR